jgi:hypothetical protein
VGVDAVADGHGVGVAGGVAEEAGVAWADADDAVEVAGEEPFQGGAEEGFSQACGGGPEGFPAETGEVEVDEFIGGVPDELGVGRGG